MTSKTTIKYRVSNNLVLPYQHQEGSVVDQVPVGYYKIRMSPMVGYYLEKQSDTLPVPEHIFGSTIPRCNRIFKTYDSSSEAMGVGLFGLKGAGKSLLAAVIANEGLSRGLPVIDVSDSFCTDSDYLEFINSIQECVILFDEFLKHLSKLGTPTEDRGVTSVESKKRNVANDRQDELLTFFQGANNRKRLIILIDNNKYLLSDFIRDRPGRMRYQYDYTGVEEVVVRELCKHNGLTQEKEDALAVYSQSRGVSFDVINEVIREWVLYPEDTLEEITDVLNVPNIPTVTLVKAIVTSLKNNRTDGIKYTIQNEVTSVNGSSFGLEVNRPNPYFGSEKMDSDTFYNEDHDENIGNYDYYCKMLEEPLLPSTLRFDESNLVGIKGNLRQYRNQEVTVTLELLETSKISSTNNWNAL